MRIDFSKLESHEISKEIVTKLISNNASYQQKQAISHRKNGDGMPNMHEQKQSIYSFSVRDQQTVNKPFSQARMKQQPSRQAKPKEFASNMMSATKKLYFQSCNETTTEKVGTINRHKQSHKSRSDDNYIDRNEKKSEAIFEMGNKDNNNKEKQLAIREKKTTKQQTYQRLYDFNKKCECLKVQKIRQQQRQLNEVTLRPVLNYTMNSKTTKMVDKKRNKLFRTCQTDVFQSLYNDASLMASKRQLERVIMEQQSKSVILKSSRVKVNSTFEERLRLSIQKQAIRKKKAQQKLDYNPQTGRKYFIPNTKPGKSSFRHHQSSRRASIAPPQEQFYPARPAHYSKDSQKLNHSHEMTSTLNNSYEKDLNKSLDSKYRIVRRPLEKENKLAQLYADLLWDDQGKLKQSQLDTRQVHVLLPFFKEFQRYEQQYSKSINKQVFVALFKDFYSSLNLFDRWILDDRLKKQRQAQKSLNLKKSQSFLDVFLLTHRKKAISGLNYHTKRQYFV